MLNRLSLPQQPDFAEWLAIYFKQSPHEVVSLLRDTTAVRFLITWSIFESKCFNGYMREKDISKFANRVSKQKEFERADFDFYLKHFHERYQNKKLYRNLMHKQDSTKLEEILQKGSPELTNCDAVFFLSFVAYRCRNNIFHGNKGVGSWLRYQPQINYCSTVMQQLVILTEAARNSLLEGNEP